MSVFTQGNVMSVFVGKDTAATALASLTTDLSASMTDSQIVAVGRPVSGTKEQVIAAGSAAGTYDYFRLAYKVNGNVVYGPKVDLKNIINISASSTTAVAPQEQIYVLGYIGSGSNSLDVSQGNEFMITIAYDHDDILWSEQKLRNTYDYYSQAPTQKGLAMSMTAQINYKEQLGLINGTGAMVRAEMLADGTGTGVSGTNVAVTQGSNYITFAAVNTFAVGDLVRIGGTANTNPVYVISAVGDALGANTSTVYQIHSPYQGATSSAVSAATVGATTNYGIKLTGQALTWQKDFFKFNKVKFHLDLKGFGSTTLTKTQESKKGIGYYQEVAEYESFAAGNEGILNRMVVPLPVGRQYADTTGTLTFTSYTTTSISSTDYSFTSSSSLITGNNAMRIQQFIFWPGSGSTNGASNRGILASQLNSLLGASL